MRGGLRVALAGSGFSPASQTLFSAMTVQPDGTRKRAIDTMIKALMSADVWDLLDVLHVYAAHTEQAALLNWKNPGTFNGTNVSATTFTVDRGFTGDGVADYIDTNFNASTAGGVYAQNSACMFGRTLSTGTSDAADYGGESVVEIFTHIYPRHTDGNAYLNITAVNDTNRVAVASASASGLWSVTRSAATAIEGFKNGASIGTGSSTSNALPNTKHTVLRIGASFSNRQVASFGLGAHLSSARQAALYNAELVYMQAVGAVA